MLSSQKSWHCCPSLHDAGILWERLSWDSRMLSHTVRKGAGCNPSVFDVVEEGKQKKG